MSSLDTSAWKPPRPRSELLPATVEQAAEYMTWFVNRRAYTRQTEDHCPVTQFVDTRPGSEVGDGGHGEDILGSAHRSRFRRALALPGRCGELIPARVALRWAMRYRRYRVQSSTLEANLRVLGKVYRWTHEIQGFDLDDRLTQGRTLQNREIESLARSFRGAKAKELDTGSFDQHLTIVDDFLKWSLDSENRGGRRSLGLAELAQERDRSDHPVVTHGWTAFVSSGERSWFDEAEIRRPSDGLP